MSARSNMGSRSFRPFDMLSFPSSSSPSIQQNLTNPADVEKALANSQSPFAVSSIALSRRGLVDLCYRCTLATPYTPEDNPEKVVTTVIVKPAGPFTRLSLRRSQIEYLMYSCLPISVGTKNVTVTTPKAFHYLSESYTAIVEDVPNTRTLKDVLRSSESLPVSVASCLGSALARYLVALYFWSRQPEQAALRQKLNEFQWSRTIGYEISYGLLPAAVQKYMHLLGDKVDFIEQAREQGQRSIAEASHLWGICHGDFWTGNALLFDKSTSEGRAQVGIHIVGWETAKLALPYFDCGQMLAYLYLPFHFYNTAAGYSAIQSLCREVAKSELINVPDFPRRVAIHVGTHLIVCPYQSGWPLDKVEASVRLGGELIKRALLGDMAWLRASILGELFEVAPAAEDVDCSM